MELKGKIVKLLPVQTGTSSRGEWRKQEFIIESTGPYAKQACIYAWGDKVDEFKLVEGEQITASIEIESREYNGKWYTNVKAWKVERDTTQAQDSSTGESFDGAPPASPFSEPKMVDLSEDEDDGLPF